MLKNISPLISPELLKIMAAMGHGDTLVLGDCNYPADSTGKRCVRADGIGAVALLDAIMGLLPLDVNEDTEPVVLMSPSDAGSKEPDIWTDFKSAVLRHEPEAAFSFADRFKFYDLAKNAYATVQTGEQRFYGCIILRKGTMFTK